MGSLHKRWGFRRAVYLAIFFLIQRENRSREVSVTRIFKPNVVSSKKSPTPKLKKYLYPSILQNTGR